MFDLIKYEKLINNLRSEADRSIHNPAVMYSLLNDAANTISTLLVHISYLQQKLQNAHKNDKN